MKYGLVIVVVALFGAVLAGSIGVTEESRTSEAFERVTDLAPIVSYSAVEDEILYNPPQNITGWSGASFTYQDSPSLYSYVEGATSASSTFTTSAPVGVYYTSSASVATAGSAPVVKWNDDSSGWVEASVMSGGYRTSDSAVQTGIPYVRYYYADTYVSVHHNDLDTDETAVLNGDPLFFNSLDQIAIANNWPSGTTVTAAGATSGAGIYLDQGTVFSSQYNTRTDGTNSITYTTSASLTQNVATTDETYYWNAETASWYLVEGSLPNGVPAVTSVAYRLVLVGTAASGQTVDLVTYTTTDVKYIKPNTEASVVNTTTGAVWQNGYTNTSMELIVQPQATITSGAFSWTLPSSSSTYVRCLAHIDPNGDSYWQGITRYAGPSDYDIVDYQFPLTRNNVSTTVQVTLTNESQSWTFYFPAGAEIVIEANSTMSPGDTGSISMHWTGSTMSFDMDIPSPGVRTYSISGTVDEDTTITMTPSNMDAVWTFNVVLAVAVINSVTVTHSSTAYVLNTWMPRDAEGLLWGNPTFDAAGYFPDLMPLRVQINAAVLTGNTLTVNGTALTVTDNSVELTVDGETVLVPISGMGIEWRADGNTYIVAADGTSYSLGTTTSTAVTGSGSWYLSGEVQQITTRTVTDLVPVYGDVPTATWSIFAFIGLCIMGAVVMLAAGRSSLAITDWAIILGAAIIGVMLL